MKLKRLVLQGFKSFKDKTTIYFDDGITGIVGPNGCGKSNIVDALFWVMGEQSAKHLRGNSMKDVIFSGSEKHTPAAWAEVTLVLENEAGKHIHIGGKVSRPTEIALKRKLYRNGETEYRINDLPCRLKDIQEVFMDTGAGAKSYSIIAQGEINRLVQAKPVERRVMIEEVAGITKFKLRRKESMKKIEQTQTNLHRIEDLQSEISKNLSSLQKQAEKAERAKSLKDKIKKNDLVVNSHKEFDFLKDYREKRNGLVEKRTEMEVWSTQKETLEVSLQEERLIKTELTSTLDQAQAEYNEKSRNLATHEERLNSLKRELEDKGSQLDMRSQEIEESRQELSERKAKLAEIKNDQAELASRNHEEFDFSELTAEVTEMSDRLSELKETMQSQEAIYFEKKEVYDRQSQMVQINETKITGYANSLEDLALEIDSLEKSYSSVSTEMVNERQVVNNLETEVQGVEGQLKSLKEHVASLRDDFRATEERLRSKTKAFIQTESKLESLTEIQRNLSSENAGTAKFLETDASTDYEVLGNLVSCEEKYAKAVQAVLSPITQSLVGSDGKTLVDWQKNQTQLGIDFTFSLNTRNFSATEVSERMTVNGLSGISHLPDVIDFKNEKSKLDEILQGFFIVENLDAEKVLSLPADMSLRGLVSLDGRVLFRKDWASGHLKVYNANQDAMKGMVERNLEIEKLKEELDLLATEKNELQAKYDDLGGELETETAKTEELQNEFSEKKADFAGRKSSIDSQLAHFESQNSRLEILKKRKSEISTARLTLLEEQAQAAKQNESLEVEIAELKASLASLKSDIESRQSAFEIKRDELSARQLEAKTYETRLNAYQGQIDDLQTQVEKLQERISMGEQMIEGFKTTIDEIETKLQVQQEENHAEASLLKEEESKLVDMKDELNTLTTQMSDRETEVKKLSANINKNEKDLVSFEMKLEQIVVDEEEVVKDIFEKYRIDLREIVSQHLDYIETDFEGLQDITGIFLTEEGETIAKEGFIFNRRYGQDLKDCREKLRNYKKEYNGLGDINWQAVEDYNRQKIRFDFLKEQETELRTSMADLEQAIEHIDNKSKARFSEAYNEVSDRFKKVFPIIFGGGEANLKLVGSLDEEDCGIDILASPPGKKMQNINLMSGGEKALTAVSMIFSIFLVKPSPFCLLDEVDAPLDDANVGRFNELLREMSDDSQFILITHNKKTMELNDTLYGVTMQDPGVSNAVSVQIQ